MMKKIALTILFTLTATVLLAFPIGEIDESALPRYDVVLADTTQWGEELDDEEETVEKPTQQNLATEFHALDYVMENRYRPVGETFSPGWKRNLFFQASIGVERIAPVSANGLYEIKPITVFSGTVGTHLNELHTLRMSFQGGMGYQQMKNTMYFKLGARLEHLYDLSAYLVGYNTTRLANVSSILGFGAQHARFKGAPESGTSLEAHVGAQIKFYTGPHAYLTFEPYIGVGGDQMDLSGEKNWRGYDIFYGANVGLTYYLRNNLAPESRMRLIEARMAHNELSRDSVLKAWQQPWFVQVATGVALMNSPRLGMMETLGSEMSLSVGKWLSPVIGLRGTLSSRTTTWNKQITPADPTTYHPEYREDLNNHYKSVRLEAMLNPMGFFETFDWNAPLGFSVVAGVELGQLHKAQQQKLTTYSEAYGGGVNLWWQPTEGLKLFVEPRFMHCVYRIPYTNVDWRGRFSDNNYTLSLGMTIETRNVWRWYKEPSYEYQYLKDPLRMLTFGLGGGSNLVQTTQTNTEGSRLGFNGLFFGEYHFNRESSARLGVEYLFLRRSNISDYTDYNMDYPEAGYAPVPRYGLWDHKFHVIAVSPGYQGNLNQWIYGYQSAPLKLHAFAGPTVFLRMKPKSQLSPLERLMENHTVALNIPQKTTFHVGAHLGFKLDYRLNSHLGLFFSPTVYWVNNMELPGINLNKLHLIETFNIGVQYGFMRKR